MHKNTSTNYARNGIIAHENCDALHNVQRLCIETAPFIYFVESHASYVDKMRAIFREVRANQISIISSTVTLTEVLTKPLQASDAALIANYRQMLLNTQGITLLPNAPHR